MSGPASEPVNHLDAVLFLDVDGVLHMAHARHTRLMFRKSCMELLRDVLSETNARIVLSTTWRLTADGRAHVASKLAEYGIPTFVDRTPSIAQFNRPAEILSWVAKHKPSHWLALDDWPLHEDERMTGHFVQTRNRHGLQEDTAARVIECFKRQRDGVADGDSGGGGAGGGGSGGRSGGICGNSGARLSPSQPNTAAGRANRRSQSPFSYGGGAAGNGGVNLKVRV